MKVRKLQADRLFDGFRFLDDHVLVLDEDNRVADLLPAADAGGDVEKLQGLLSPGLVNCHCHLELSHMKGRIPEGTGLVDFVFKVVNERHHAEDFILESIAKGEEEMLRNGIVAVGDICNNTWTLAQKRLARMDYYNFIEASGWLPGLAQARWDRAKEIFEAFEERSPGTNEMQVSMVPHAPYSVSEALWQRLVPYFRGRTVSMHNQETAFEDAFFRTGSGDLLRMYQLMNISNSHHQPTGRSSLASTFHHLQPAARIMLVHNTFTQQEDIDQVNQPAAISGEACTPDVFFCLCVNANRYIERCLPPVALLRRNGCAIVLGTDSLASNWSLNLFDELRTIRAHFPAIPLEELLQWATSNGARALGLDDRLGSFQPGKKPGVLLIGPEDFSVTRWC